MSKVKIPKEKMRRILEAFTTVPVSVIIAFAILCTIASPFVWIWYSWAVAWKLGLSGILGMIIFNKLYDLFKKAIDASIDEDKDLV